MNVEKQNRESKYDRRNLSGKRASPHEKRRAVREYDKMVANGMPKETSLLKLERKYGFASRTIRRWIDKEHESLDITEKTVQAGDAKEETALSHDIKIFKASDAIMDEPQFNEFLDSLDNNHMATRDQFSKAEEFRRFFDLISSKYLSEYLARLALGLRASLVKLSRFTTLNFFIYPESQAGPNYRLYLNPDLIHAGVIPKTPEEIAEDREEYKKLSTELENIIDDVKLAYMNYRLEIKKILLL
jgi:hypothetical protein